MSESIVPAPVVPDRKKITAKHLTIIAQRPQWRDPLHVAIPPQKIPQLTLNWTPEVDLLARVLGLYGNRAKSPIEDSNGKPDWRRNKEKSEDNQD